MTTYHYEDVEIQLDTTHADSPWVDVALMDGKAETPSATGVISLTSREARDFGRDLIANADRVEGVNPRLRVTEFDTIQTSIPLGLDDGSERGRALASRARRLEQLGGKGWSLVSTASGASADCLVIVDTLQWSPS